MDPNQHVGNNSPPDRSQPAPPADNPTAPVLIPRPRRFRGAGTSVHHGNYNPPAFLPPAPQNEYIFRDQLSPRYYRREEHSDESDHSTPTNMFHMDFSDEGENVEVQARRQAVRQEAQRPVYAADTGEGSTSAASVVNTVNANSGERSTPAASGVNTVNANSGNPVEANSQEKGSSSTAVSQNKDSSAIAASQKEDSSPIATSDIKGEGSTSAASDPVKADSQEKGSSPTAVSQKKDSSPIATSDIKGADRDPDRDRKKDVPSPQMQFDDANRVEKAKKRSVLNQTEARNRVELFRHLPEYEHGTRLTNLESKFFELDTLHPAVYKVGLRYLAGDISGGNARCIAMLQAFRESINDYTTPPKKAFTSDLKQKINSYVSFLIECRPLSISMANAIRFLKTRITKLSVDLSDVEAKASLISDIDSFISENITLADKEIVNHAVTKIKDGDVLLTYTSSSAVEMLLVHAHELGKKFRVVIVDSRPKLEGRMLLRRLVGKGISCTYTHINAISYIMHEATRVFLGASSVFSNGTVYSRVGTASVAMVAHQFHIPVLMCCEAYKFHERVQLDSICFNEIGDPDVISKVSGRKEINYLDGWANSENLQLLNLIYDVTPSDYVSLIISDCGMIPTTSVPVIVHEYRRGDLWTERYIHRA